MAIWNWMKALMDGGLVFWFFMIGATIVFAALHCFVRPNASRWEQAAVPVAVFLLGAIYPAWQLVFSAPPIGWEHFAVEDLHRDLTYDKMIWLALWGVIIGRSAFAILHDRLIRDW